MANAETTITFRAREFKGSRLRCLLLTSQTDNKVADFLMNLVAPHAFVTPEHHWAPRGFVAPDEARLVDTEPHEFLSKSNRDLLTSWWLARPGRANTPNWDVVSTCLIGGRSGLILVEAKAHDGEFGDDKCGATDPENVRSIDEALSEATAGWDALAPGFALSAKCRYQLSNRFAFAWKLASMGVPIVLVYLGFLHAHEMDDGNRILLKDHAGWQQCVLAGSGATVPHNIWEKTFDVGGTPLTALIRSATVGVQAR